MKTAAKRITFGKLLNAGQTCIAPDHIYVDSAVEKEFTDILKQTFDEYYQKEKSRFPVIINDKHFKRVRNLIDPDKVIYGGNTDEARRFIEPTILVNVTTNDPVMQEEIFGPLMPIIPYDNLDKLIKEINSRPAPLALYMFSESKAALTHVFERIRFGGGAMNDTITHVTNPNLPFGGIGRSGFGRYHGYYSFKEFSHFKSFVKKSTRFDLGLTDPRTITYMLALQ